MNYLNGVAQASRAFVYYSYGRSHLLLSAHRACDYHKVWLRTSYLVKDDQRTDAYVLDYTLRHTCLASRYAKWY